MRSATTPVTEDDSGNACLRVTHLAQGHTANSLRRQESRRLHSWRAVLLPSEVASCPEDTGSQTKEGHQSRFEDDTHADTWCLGANFRLLCYTGHSCDVSAFLDSYGTVENVPIASGASHGVDRPKHRYYSHSCFSSRIMVWYQDASFVNYPEPDARARFFCLQ